MKKKCFSILLLGAFLIASTSMFVSCKGDDYDDADLRSRVTTTATDLTSLVNEKVANVQTEIDALKNQQSALETAYKAADEALEAAIAAATNDAKGYADIQAAEAQRAAIASAQALVDEAVSNLEAALASANEKISSQGQTINGLLAVDAQLQQGINTAQAKADAAYSLAEKANAQAEANKTSIAGVAENLKTINETLSAQINVLGERVTAVEAAAAKNAADILAQETALSDLKNANDKALAQLNAKDNELQALIEANQKEIADLKTAVEEAKAAAAQALTDAKAYVDQEIAALSERFTNIDLKAYDTKLSNIEGEYKAADEALQEKITALQAKVLANESAITTINQNIAKINQMLSDLINNNINNLITSIIYQARSAWDNVYAQVKGSGAVVIKPNSNNQYILFPYNGATDVKELKVGTYNIQEYAGYLYATINPADIDATKATISLENSLGNKSAYYTLDMTNAKAANVTITRAATSKNGLWELPVKSIWESTKNPATNVDDKLYALTTSYKAYILENGASKEVEKKLYSHYAIDKQPTLATAVTAITLVGTGSTLDNAPAAGVDIQFSALEGKLVMGTGNKPVYKKYIECVSVKNSQNAEVVGAAASFNGANTGVFKKTLDAANEGGDDEIDVNCPQTLSNYKVTLRYYIWNYDGTVYSIDKVVVFNKLLWNNENATVTITPTSSAVQSEFSTEFPNFAFVKGTKGLNNTTWPQEAYYVNAKATGSAAGQTALLNGNAAITFMTQNKQTVCTNVSVVNSDAKTQLSNISNIKQMRFSYDPAALKPGTYTMTISFFDQNGFKVNIMNLTVTIKEPTAEPNPWHIPAAFDESEKLTIGWATPYPDANPNHVAQTGALYDFSGSFYKVDDAFDALGSYYIFRDNASYGSANNQTPVKYRPTATAAQPQYEMVVPNASMNEAAGQEHVYNLTAGIRFFGLSSLDSYSTEAQASSPKGWKDDFTIKFLSPIRYAILGTKDYITGKTYEGMTVESISVMYRQSVTIGNAQFSAIDPKEADDYSVKFFEGYDERIVDVQVEFAETTGNNALFSSITKNADGTFTLATSNKVSMTGPAVVKFNLVVTDVWGCVTTKQFSVTVVPNQ